MRVYDTGLSGEQQAEEYLLARGYETVCRRWRAEDGEIDLIMRDGSCLVFVEVKLRKSADCAAAREYVDRKKQERLRTTAAMYLTQNPTPLRCRFDIIEIYAPDGMNTAHPEINHMEDAFQ